MRAGKYDINEESLGRIYQHIVSQPKTKTWGVLTAHRGEMTPAENIQRNKQLEGKLRDLGLGLVRGAYREVCRTGWCTHCTSPKRAVAAMLRLTDSRTATLNRDGERIL